MVKKMRIVLWDDLDRVGGVETPAGETIFFSVDGGRYVIDLTADHAAAFRELMKPYIQAAELLTRGSDRKWPAAAAPRRTNDRGQSARVKRADRNKAIRTYGKSNGWPVSDFGPIPAALITEWEAKNAH